MKRFYHPQIKQINLCDCTISQIKWTQLDNNDVEFVIDWCGQDELCNDYDFDNIETRMYFYNISNFIIQGEYTNNTIGMFDINDFSYTLNSNKRYELSFDLFMGNNSLIQFECEDFFFEINDKNDKYNV